ncbi:hypothetical protein [Carboxylicivirga linearis]|uniref:Uncharacterized protein n=1 Tax=Carboxylicivirga linearis TaxID=1628157 RepID=A0ABS5JTV5_9BACT|nr:hypothetical protein [Carboxylicivirga linearis]MBS2098335.1 hypothetical protein [Carboxylicivirga linearis]
MKKYNEILVVALFSERKEREKNERFYLGERDKRQGEDLSFNIELDIKNARSKKTGHHLNK